MAHPPLDAILALPSSEPTEELRRHLVACAMCRELAESVGVSPTWRMPSVELRVVPRDVYARVRALDRGGMGRTTLARDTRLEREVVLKEMLPRDAYADPVTYQRHRDRFEREAALTASLEHPSIVAVYEAGWWEDGEPFYAMAYVPGGTLREAIAQRASGLLAHLERAADALAYAHGRGVVHRDVKPDNILVGGFGETVVIDWGLASAGDEPGPAGPVELEAGRGALTRAGAGTAGYVAPEQRRGRPPDPRMDVHALGVSLREALYDELPPELASIVGRATAEDPNRRYPDAQALGDELRRLRAGELVHAHSYAPWDPVFRWIARNRRLFGVIVAALVVVMVVSGVAFRRVVTARDDAERASREARGALASQLARVPSRRIEALEVGVLAVDGTDQATLPEVARRGLLDAARGSPAALAVGPPVGTCLADIGEEVAVVGGGRLGVYGMDRRTPRFSIPHAASDCRFTRTSPDHTRLLATHAASPPVVFDLRARVATSLDHELGLMTDAVWVGDAMALAPAEGLIHVFDATGRLTRRWEPGAPVAALAARDGALAWATTAGEVVVLGDDGPVAWFQHGRELVGMGATPDGALVVADAEGAVFELTGPDRVRRLREADGGRINHVDATATHLLVWLRFGGVELRRRDDGVLTHRVPGFGSTFFPPFSADGRRFLTLAPDRASAQVRDVETGRVVAGIGGLTSANDIGFLRPDLVLVTGRGDNVVFDASPGPPAHRGEVTGLFVQDGRLHSVALDGEVRVWEGQRPRVLARLAAGVHRATVVDGVAWLRDVDGGVWRLDRGGLAPATAAAWGDGDPSPDRPGVIAWRRDGSGWAFGTQDGRACLIAEDGREDCAEVGVPVTAVARVGAFLVAGLQDGRVRFLPLSVREARRRACATLARFDRRCGRPPGSGRAPAP